MRLAQVVGNLLTNAAKYTEPDGRIWLTAEREGGEAVLRVRDNGIGIAPDMLPRIFELFVQVDHAATRSQGGLGIGLTLVKNLVRDARRDGRGPQRRAGQGERVRRAPAALGTGLDQDRGRETEPHAHSRRRLRATGCWSWTTTRTPPTASPCCCGCKATRSGSPTAARRRWR